MNFVQQHPHLVVFTAIVVASLLFSLMGGLGLLLRLFGAVVVPSDSYGIVKKRFTLLKSKSLPDGAIIALDGEAGIQAETIAPGLHFGYWPWQYNISITPFLVISKGQLGVVEAKDGTPLPAGRVLAKTIDCDAYQNAEKFLKSGGERGIQLAVIPPGSYRINTELFKISSTPAIQVPDDRVGVVTAKEGKQLDVGEIAGPIVPNHNSFQDGQAFISNGGCKGRQEQVILAGTYFINPFFATVEAVPLTEVPIAHVGVVVSYVGPTGTDVSGDKFQHGNLVSKGQKGVWNDPLDPGKYAINPYVQKVELVPTANVVLNWADNKSEAHQLDANLCTITVRSSDGYKFNLDVSQIIHIPRQDAPAVISRFGSMQNLVTQVLEPTIGNYFRNAAQKSDVIDFLKARVERQGEAKDAIGGALHEYNVNAVDTLIGDIVPPDELMKTLTDRKLAEQQQITFRTQQATQETRKELAQAQAMADTQPSVVTAERQVQIKEFDAQAAVKKAEGEAKSKTVQAEADASVLTLVGNATAAKTLAIGNAEATVIKNKIDSMDADNYARIQVAEALALHNIKLVPDIMVTGDQENGNMSGVMSVLFGTMLRDSLKNNNGKKEEVVLKGDPTGIASR